MPFDRARNDATAGRCPFPVVSQPSAGVKEPAMRCLVLTLATMLLLLVSPSWAQPAPTPAAPHPAPAASSPTSSPPPAEIDGFRSAKFGMTEPQVLNAIERDFGIKETQIHREHNPVQKTSALVVDVKDLLPGTGIARVSYLFGYESKKLFTVVIVWARVFNRADSREALVDAAAVLRSHFESEAFPRDVVIDSRLPDGSVLVFRGMDSQGRMVALTATGLYEQNLAGNPRRKAAQPAPVLRLTYIENPQHPDVYSIKRGQF